MSYGYIYVIENTINNKKYVGQSIDLKSRWKNHCSGRWTGVSLIDAAIQKYGRDYFELVILEACQNINELNKKEIFWIKELESLSPNGYNLETGGRKGEIVNKITKSKMSAARKGPNNPMFGKKHSKETIEKMRNAKLGKRLSTKHRDRIGKGTKESKKVKNKWKNRRHPWFGRQHTEETKRKMSVSKRRENENK